MDVITKQIREGTALNLFINRNLYQGNGKRPTGWNRYRDLLERNFQKLLKANLLTILLFLPYAAGVALAILSSSILILLPACIIGGAIAGPALACMYDTVFRSLREAPGGFMDNYKHAWKQNWRQSIVPGIIFCTFMGFYLFMLMLFWWATRFPGFGTIAIFLCGLLLWITFFAIYWPLLVLFEQTGIQRFKNSILFILRFFWKMMGISALQLLYWAVMILFLPWSVILLPIAGIWFILYSANFLLYDTINETFHLEEQIAESYPEQVPFYEDDETWLKRKQEELREIDC